MAFEDEKRAGRLPPLIAAPLALAAGFAGGWAFHALRLPLPWLLGPMIVIAAAALIGWSPSPPRGGRAGGQVVVGCAIGLAFTPSVAASVAAALGWMLASSAALMAASALLALLLARLSGASLATTYFAMLPGGVAEMSVLAESFGASGGLVAFAQSLRVAAVVLILPASFALLTPDAAAPTALPPALPLWAGLALLLAAAVLGFVLRRWRVFNAWLIGPIVVGMAAALSGFAAGRMSPPLLIVGQVVLGCALGARFRRDELLRFRHYLPLVLVAVLILLAVGLVPALLLARFGVLPFATAVLASAPGGIVEMSLTAEAFRLSVAAVTAFQAIRILIVILCAAPLYRLLARVGTPDGC